MLAASQRHAELDSASQVLTALQCLAELDSASRREIAGQARNDEKVKPAMTKRLSTQGRKGQPARTEGVKPAMTEKVRSERRAVSRQPANSARTVSVTSVRLTSVALPARGRTSTLPSFIPRPATTMMGAPISSASANLTPGETLGRSS